MHSQLHSCGSWSELALERTRTKALTAMKTNNEPKHQTLIKTTRVVVWLLMGLLPGSCRSCR